VRKKNEQKESRDFVLAVTQKEKKKTDVPRHSQTSRSKKAMCVRISLFYSIPTDKQETERARQFLAFFRFPPRTTLLTDEDERLGPALASWKQDAVYVPAFSSSRLEPAGFSFM